METSPQVPPWRATALAGPDVKPQVERSAGGPEVLAGGASPGRVAGAA